MKIAIITDQHFGCRKNSKLFHDYFLRFYEDVFFPTIEKEGITTIVDMGDTFDSRKGIDFGALNWAKENYYDRLNKMGITVHTIVGNHTSLFIGVPYSSVYRLSTQYIRENTGRGLVAITAGRYQIRNISFNFENSGFFQVEVTPNNRDKSTTIMNGYVIGTSSSLVGQPAISSGTLRVPVQCRNTEFVMDIKSNSHLPVYIADAEIEGYYHSRSRRI